METLNNIQQATKWTIDPAHSELTFKVRHLMISNVKGEFKAFEVDLRMEDDDFVNADLQVKVDVSSITTKNEDRDDHLKSEDFFDLENHLTLSFEAQSIEQVDGNDYQMKGLLTIRGVSKEVILDVEFGGFMKDPYGNEKAGFSLSGKLNRKAFGLNWNTALEAGGVMVGDEVKLNAEVQLVKQA